PDDGGREVRPPPRREVLGIRKLVDPPWDHHGAIHEIAPDSAPRPPFGAGHEGWPRPARADATARPHAFSFPRPPCPPPPGRPGPRRESSGGGAALRAPSCRSPIRLEKTTASRTEM